MDFGIDKPATKKILQDYENIVCGLDLFYISLRDLPNPDIYRHLIADIEELGNFIDGALDEFDGPGKLLAEHILHSLGTEKNYALYSFEFPDRPVDDFLEEALGDNIIENIEEQLSLIDYDRIRDYLVFGRKLRNNRLPVDDDHVFSMLKDYVKQLQGTIVDWGRKKGYLPPDLEVEMVLTPYYRRMSSYNPELGRIEIDPTHFYVFKRKGGLHVNPGLAVEIIFHELFGHAVNGSLSKRLPRVMQADWFHDRQHVTIPLSEGIAVYREELGQEYVRENKDELGLGDDDIQYSKSLRLINDIYLTQLSYYGYLQQKRKEAPGIRVEKRLVEVTGNKGFFKNFAEAKEFHFIEFYNKIASLVGSSVIKETLGSIGRLYGEDFIEKHPVLMNEALMTGSWSWKVYPEFVRSYIKENRKDGNG